MAQRWIDTGVYYTDRQLSGAYEVQTLVDNLYPPHALYLFIPFLVLPDLLWWAIPLGVIAYIVWWCRPVAWMWPILALIVLFPKTPGQILFGNTDMWVAAAIAAGVRWGWPSVLTTFKPSLAFFAVIGIRSRLLVDRRRRARRREPAVPGALARLCRGDDQLEREVLVFVRESPILPAADRRVARFEPTGRHRRRPWARRPASRRGRDTAASSEMTRTRTVRRRWAVLAIFVLSGAAGLIYEIVWSRQLVLVFGNTTQAVSAILAGFFGGMAIGSAIGGRLADRVRAPLRLYGALELVLVLVVVATPLTFRIVRTVYGGFALGLEDSPQILAVVRLSLAIIALAPATILMGATLPTLTRYLTSDAHLSQAFGRLYAANTIGAIIGTVAAGLNLIEWLGLTGALWVGAACSGIAGVAALMLSSRSNPVVVASASEPAGARDIGLERIPGPRTALAFTVAFISGLTSLGYQVLWTRLLASGTGNTTYVFTVILAIFLVGLAAGAVLFNFIRPRIGHPVRLLASAQILIAALVLAGLVGVVVRPEALDPMAPLSTIRALVGAAIIVVLPVTIVLGMTFPAASALLEDDARHAGSESGSLLAVNTVGAIVASVLIPFLLIPVLGSPMVVALLALVNAVLGIALAVRCGRRAVSWLPSVSWSP